MNKDFKRTFFTCLLAVLLVISNLIGLKLTNFFDLTISVDFLTFPFTFLCTLLIYNMGGKKKAYESILIAALIQIFIIISYTLAIKLGSQSVIPDLSEYVNVLFKVDEVKMLSSLLSFLVSHYVLIYIYENFKNYGKELFGVVISLLVALFLKATIYLAITLNGYDSIIAVNMLLSNIVISIILDIIITGLFYLLKEKEIETVYIEGMNINVRKSLDDDKTIEDIIVKQKEENKTTKKKTYKKSNNYKNKNGQQNNQKKQVKKSKIKVNKEDKK